MGRFPSAGHAASWAGICPGNDESAGKRRSGRTRKGNRWLRETLVECARAATHKRNSYLSAQYRRLVARRGDKKAIVARGHSMLVAAWHILKHESEFRRIVAPSSGADGGCPLATRGRRSSGRRARWTLEPRIQMLDGFNEGWIELAGGEGAVTR
jgi:Transposase IS116/IS110/IS902 family